MILLVAGFMFKNELDGIQICMPDVKETVYLLFCSLSVEALFCPGAERLPTLFQLLVGSDLAREDFNTLIVM